MRLELRNLVWIWDEQERKLNVYVYNINKTKIRNIANGEITEIPTIGLYDKNIAKRLFGITGNCECYDFEELFELVWTNGFPIFKKEYDKFIHDPYREGCDAASMYINTSNSYDLGTLLDCTKKSQDFLIRRFCGVDDSKDKNYRRF